MDNPRVFVVSIGITFLCFVIWVGLFTGLNLPEINRAKEYYKTKCYVNDSSVIRRYCPTKSCPDSCASTSAASCGSITNQMKVINADTCTNTTLPPCPITQTCDDGYYCCSTVCTTTRDSKGHYHTTCHCAQNTAHRACTITPTYCYTLRLFVWYNATHDDGHFVSTTYDFDMDKDIIKVAEYKNDKYQVNHSYPCFYNSKNVAIIRWSISQTAGFWVASGLFATFTFVGMFISTIIFIANQQLSNDSSKIACLFGLAIWFWFGLVLGLGLFLPLGLNPHVPASDRHHLLPLAISWTCLWTGLWIVWMIYRFDGWYTIQRQTRQIKQWCVDMCLSHPQPPSIPTDTTPSSPPPAWRPPSFRADGISQETWRPPTMKDLYPESPPTYKPPANVKT